MNNSTVRPLLWIHKKNKQGVCPLMICVTIQRKKTYLKTNYYLREDQWDAENREIVNFGNNGLANAVVSKRITELKEQIATGYLVGNTVTPRKLRLGNTLGNTEYREFDKFAKEIRDNPKEINRVVAFGRQGLLVSDIDATFLRKYEAHERARSMSQNTINLTFKYLRRIIRQAVAEKLIKENPFDTFRVPGYIQSERVYLVEEEKQRLIALMDDPGLSRSLYNSLCWFLFGCYTGLRHSDWKHFKPSMIENGYLKLRAQKNGKWVVLPIGTTLPLILQRLRELPAPVSGQKLNVHLKAIASIAKINKEITTHSARHSFATMCATLKLPHGVTAELLGVNYRTVSVYYHISGQAMEEQAAVLRTI